MELRIKDQNLVIELNWREKVAAMRGSFEIPLAHIVSASMEKPESSWREVRVAGSYIPSLIKAGTHRTKIGNEFWYLERGKKPLVLELSGEKYKRMVLGPEHRDYWYSVVSGRLSKESKAGKDN